MNQMDENYWKQLAQDWIKRQATQNEMSNVEIPKAPNISNYQENYDSLDMEIEKEDEQALSTTNWDIPSNQIWDSTAVNNHSFANIQSQQFLNIPEQYSISSNSRHPKDALRRNFNSHETPLIIPDPPSINPVEDQINSVDMELNSDDSSSSFNMMEIQARKKLPVWIREGLEKMKREKELEKSRIKEELRRKEDEENRKRILEEAMKEIEKEKKFSKSKYDSSDSENEETEKPVMPQIKHKKFDSIENDEEAYENMMLLVRKTLTSLLLEVTDEKIQEISNETLSKYRKQASATTKPAMMKLGLGAYSSSTDEESGDENNENSDWETDSVIKERIYQKQLTFEKRMREKMEKTQAAEEEKLKKKSSMEQFKHQSIKNSNSDDEKQQKVKSTRIDGEEKYETMIYSISTSSGPIVRTPREKKTRFSDPKDGRSTTQMTHLGMVESSSKHDNVANPSASKLILPPAPPLTVETSQSLEIPKNDKKENKSKRRDTSDSSSSDSAHRKKHKKHKKSSKHSKKSSKKRDRSRSRSRSRDRDKKHNSSRSDRHSIESKSSMRSSESSRRRSRSRSKSRDRYRRRY